MDNIEVAGVPARLVMDPRVDCDSEQLYIIRKGAEHVRYDTNITTSSSDSSINFSVVPPNANIACDKRVWIDLQVQFTLTGPDTGVPLVSVEGGAAPGQLLGNTDGLRWMPLHSVCESLSVSFNQTNVSQNLRQYIEAVTRCGYDPAFEGTYLSVAPSMHDQYQNYGDYVVWGSGRNPLNKYGENSAQQPRGALSYLVTAVSNTSATIIATWSEPILMSPFLLDKMQEKGFLGLTNIDFNFQLGDLRKMWSHDAVNGHALSNIAATMQNMSKPQLRFCWMTPPLTEDIPLVNRYPYHQVTDFRTTIGSFAQGATFQQYTNNIQLSSIPSRMFIVVKPQIGQAGDDYTKSDAYAYIDNIQIQFDNKNSLLGTATSRDLYELSVRNGLQMSWAQWSKFCGSVVVIDFARDISLSSAQAVGMSGNYNLSVQISGTNLAPNYDTVSVPNVTKLEAHLIVVNEGVFQLEGTLSSLSVGDVTSRDVLEAVELGYIEKMPWEEAYSYAGGSFFGKLKKIASKVGRVAKQGLQWGLEKGIPLAQKGLQAAESVGITVPGEALIKKGLEAAERYGPAALHLAEQVGLGYAEDMYMKNAMRRAHSGAGLSGGFSTAGARAPRASLRNRRM